MLNKKCLELLSSLRGLVDTPDKPVAVSEKTTLEELHREIIETENRLVEFDNLRPTFEAALNKLIQSKTNKKIKNQNKLDLVKEQISHSEDDPPLIALLKQQANELSVVVQHVAADLKKLNVDQKLIQTEINNLAKKLKSTLDTAEKSFKKIKKKNDNRHNMPFLNFTDLIGVSNSEDDSIIAKYLNGFSQVPLNEFQANELTNAFAEASFSRIIESLGGALNARPHEIAFLFVERELLFLKIDYSPEINEVLKGTFSAVFGLGNCKAWCLGGLAELETVEVCGFLKEQFSFIIDIAATTIYTSNKHNLDSIFDHDSSVWKYNGELLSEPVRLCCDDFMSMCSDVAGEEKPGKTNNKIYVYSPIERKFVRLKCEEVVETVLPHVMFRRFMQYSLFTCIADVKTKNMTIDGYDCKINDIQNFRREHWSVGENEFNIFSEDADVFSFDFDKFIANPDCIGCCGK